MILTRDGKEITAIYRQDGSEVEEVKDTSGRLVYSAAREIVGDLPLRYSGRGKPLTDYRIAGNALQDGTPSADAPVDAVGCGVRTGNLFDVAEQNLLVNSSITLVDLGEDVTFDAFTVAVFFENAKSALTGAAFMSLRLNNGTNTYIGLYQMLNPDTGAEFEANVTTSGDYYATKRNVTFRYIVLYAHSTGYNRFESGNAKIAFFRGASDTKYEPYGYKLPLTVNGTEYPIYLGQVETTRRVKKLVLTGEETWDGYTDGRAGFRIVVLDASSVSQTAVTEAICSHFTADTYSNVYSDISVTAFAQRAGNTPTTAGFIFRSQTYYAKEDFIQFLKDQYANDTPVTVWYVLATPETAVVNEPLMKIGDYADTVSFAQAGATIPTVNGANVLDMTSPVKPSEAYIKGKGIKPAGYGQLTDVNDVNILDKDGRPINVHGQ